MRAAWLQARGKSAACLPGGVWLNRPMAKILLEICAASLEDCLAAQAGGADRIELNCGLMLGGLTPSLGTLIEACRQVQAPIISMIRPRPGGFCYSPSEFTVMQRDLDLMLQHGARGIAFGILTGQGEIDLPRSRQIIAQAGDREVVFHRAFDVTPDPVKALEQLIELGVKRVMTSGQEASAYNGARKIAEFIRQAAGRIEILPAGGINRFTLADVLERTGCSQVHASLSMSKTDASTRSRPQVAFGGSLTPPEDRFTTTDPQAVTALRQRLEAQP